MVNDKNYKWEEKTKLKPKEKLIGYLIEHKEPQSIMAISGATIVDYKNTYHIIDELQPVIIHKEKIGNTSLIKLNLVPNQEIYNVEDKRTEEFLSKNSKLRIVKNY